MENKVKISKDGASIDFAQSDKVPVSPKKFRQGPELEGFYRFIFENDLRKEALQVIDRIYLARKAIKMKKPLEALKKAKDAAQQALKSAIVAAPKKAEKAPVKTPKVEAKVAAPKAVKTAKVAAPVAKKAAAPKASKSIAKPAAKAKAAPAKKKKK
ncbi:MAG: hypothetical protein V4596_12810 [Bdellovibrionota bacterium]